MKRGQHQVPGLPRRQRNPHRLGIAHLADDDDVGRLPDRRAQRRGEVRGIHADLDLLDDARVMDVLVLDRILDRDDVTGVAPVDFLDERREGRALARARRSADEDETSRQLRQQLDRRRQPERREPWHARRQQSHGGGGPAALPVQIDPEAADARHAERGIHDVGFAVDSPGVRRQRGKHGLFDVHAVERPFGQRLDAAVDPQRRRRPGHEQQVAAVA